MAAMSGVFLALLVAAASDSPREQARTVLRRSGCQGCHDSDVSVAHTDALEQFDLKDPKWSDGMTDRQLPLVLRRMAERPKADLAIVRRFVDGELKARHK